MGAYLYPAAAVSGSPSYNGRMLRQTAGVLLPGASASRPLGSSSGVRSGIGTPCSLPTSTSWLVTPFSGAIDAEASAAAGPYLFSFDTNQTGTVNAANDSNPRIDILSVQVSDPSESDGTSTPGVAVVYTAGTAASTPSQPATPSRSMLVARINVPTAGGGSPTISWVAPVLGRVSVECARTATYQSLGAAGNANISFDSTSAASDVLTPATGVSAVTFSAATGIYLAQLVLSNVAGQIASASMILSSAGSGDYSDLQTTAYSSAGTTSTFGASLMFTPRGAGDFLRAAVLAGSGGAQFTAWLVVTQVSP